MAAKMSMLGPILSYSQYLRSAQERLPLAQGKVLQFCILFIIPSMLYANFKTIFNFECHPLMREIDTKMVVCTKGVSIVHIN